jgi:2-polyprenyl-6-methoxyphenol hydroxylase-like FAD-dependent oxidoreductase
MTPMKYTDIAIIGGGLAGSTAAAILGRAGISTVLIDPHPVYPPDFRVEKISGGEQLDRFARSGIAESVLRSATLDGANWIARSGYLLDKRPSRQFGMMYDQLVNTIRAHIPPDVEQAHAKVIAVSTSAERQKLTLSSDETISARLVVLANGLNIGLRRSLGIEREIVSPCHSISIGFDMAPVGRPAFDFPAMTYFSERTSDRIPYLSLFPVGDRMRANLFVYRESDDPWIRQFRTAPAETLNAALPRLRRVTGEFEVHGDVKVRPADLYVSADYLKAGIVLVGDAFETTCPVTGTGTDKVFTDVERLCNIHIPAWLATDGMDTGKIAAFYDDPVKKACDAWSSAKAYNFRSLTLENELYWRAQRSARLIVWFGQGFLRQILGSHKERAAIPVVASPSIAPSNGANPISTTSKSAEAFTEIA